jgi:hypothetical protein
MAQISKGDTFVDGQQVTGARLNQLVDSSVLLVGAITNQPSITANTLEATDSTIVNDAGTLKKATVGDFLNSNLPVTTSSITGGAGVDLALNPAAGQKVDINGAFEANSINSTGVITSAGNNTVGGNLAVTGTSTLTGNVNANGNFTNTGIANFTGTLQYKSTPIFGLYQVTATLITTIAGYVDIFNNIRLASLADGWAVAGGDVTGAGGGVHWKESHTIPAGEMWEITWNWSSMKGTDDAFAVGIIRNVGGGAWTQIFNSIQSPYIYTNTPLCNVEILTNSTASPVTYNYAFKSACGLGSATDQAIVCHGGGATRIIRRYKIA